MSRDFDDFPTYDPVIKDQNYLSNIWSDFIATFVETLRSYLSSFGVFVPQLTTTQRDSIQSPVLGQMIYVSDSNQLQIWQVVEGTEQWTVIV